MGGLKSAASAPKPTQADLSVAFRPNPRETILALMENYMDIVFELDEITVQMLRKKG
jgi:hypothetical protein